MISAKEVSPGDSDQQSEDSIAAMASHFCTHLFDLNTVVEGGTCYIDDSSNKAGSGLDSMAAGKFDVVELVWGCWFDMVPVNI